MKVTRVILTANENPIYYQFWNPISKIYKENFKIQPTLIWFGKASDLERLDLSQEWGNIIVQEPLSNHAIGWQTAWAIFWFMTLYPHDIFCTMGIDQVPLSPLLIADIPSSFHDDDYLLLADDAYLPSRWETGGTSPTSFHIVKGSTAHKIYGFEKTFQEEIDKISASGVIPYYDKATKWGLDESYSSKKLRDSHSSGIHIHSRSLFKLICERRIECSRVRRTRYDANLVRSGWYGDAHLPRPLSEHREYIETLLSLIPK